MNEKKFKEIVRLVTCLFDDEDDMITDVHIENGNGIIKANIWDKTISKDKGIIKKLLEMSDKFVIKAYDGKEEILNNIEIYIMLNGVSYRENEPNYRHLPVNTFSYTEEDEEECEKTVDLIAGMEKILVDENPVNVLDMKNIRLFDEAIKCFAKIIGEKYSKNIIRKTDKLHGYSSASVCIPLLDLKNYERETCWLLDNCDYIYVTGRNDGFIDIEIRILNTLRTISNLNSNSVLKRYCDKKNKEDKAK